MPESEILAVLGGGPVARRAALSASLAGALVRLHLPDEEALARAVEAIRGEVEAAIAGGALSASDRQHGLDGILATTDRAEAVDGAAVVLLVSDDGRAELLAPAGAPGAAVAWARELAARAGAASVSVRGGAAPPEGG
jgi:hypothetical protein